MLQNQRNFHSRTTVAGRHWKYEPLPSARKFHGLGARYKGFSGPIGSGKSSAFAYEALFNACLNPGLMGLVGAPTFPMLRDAQRTFFEILDREQIGFTHRKRKTPSFSLRDVGPK
jgi:hypothetical protein